MPSPTGSSRVGIYDVGASYGWSGRGWSDGGFTRAVGADQRPGDGGRLDTGQFGERRLVEPGFPGERRIVSPDVGGCGVGGLGQRV